MSRLDEAKKVANELLDSLENSKDSVDSVLMKAKRLARLMRDEYAQIWLEYETCGYPKDFSFNQIGPCIKYAKSGGRITSDFKYYTFSLPKFEAQYNTDEAIIESLKSTRPTSAKVKDYLEKSATEALLSSQLKIQNLQKKDYIDNKALFISLKSAIHSYTTDTYIAIELGDIAESIFEKARQEVDHFISIHCPKAAEQLISINEHQHDKNSETWSTALTSCRRLLMTIADSIFPAQDEEWTDLKGKKRKVGNEEYKNRLIAYIEKNTKSDSNMKILDNDIDHLAAKLDAIYEKTCKGVHGSVSEEEAGLAIIHTYLFISEIARICKTTSD
jgi:hypothetical protein